jgi:hypothetical protein
LNIRRNPTDDGLFGAWCLSLGLGFSFLWLCFGALNIKLLGYDLLLDRQLYIPLSIGLLFYGILRCGWRLKLVPAAFALPLFLYACSDAPHRGFSFLMHGMYLGELAILAILGFFFWRQVRGAQALVFLIAAICLLLFSFFTESAGRLLISDDHASFIYRLSLLRSEFPNIPFFNPFWNAGSDARDFFATGALNFFLLFSPVLYAFPVEEVYTTLVGILLFVFFPLSLFGSARLLKLPNDVGAIAGMFGLGMSMVWYRWALHFGTMGFLCSAALSPLCLALAARAVLPRFEFRLLHALLLVVIGSLCLFWTPIGIAFAPVLIAGLFALRSYFQKKLVLLAAALLLCLNLPWQQTIKKLLLLEDLR